MATDPRSLEYLRRALALDPALQAAELIALRARFRSGASLDVAGEKEHRSERRATSRSMAAAQARESPMTREEARGVLERLRALVWRSTPEQLTERARNIPWDRFPELRATLERLCNAAAVRSDLEQIEQMPQMNLRFLERLRVILVAPAREAAAEKEAILTHLPGSIDWLNVLLTVTRIQKRFPRLYRLEADWFSDLLATRQSPVARKQSAPASVASVSEREGVPTWVMWILLWLALSALRILVRQ